MPRRPKKKKRKNDRPPGNSGQSSSARGGSREEHATSQTQSNSSAQGGSKRPTEYRKFDDGTKSVRDSVLTGMVEKYNAHRKSNGGKCKRGFVKGLVEDMQRVCPTLGINRNDFNNKLRDSQDEQDSAPPPAPSVAQQEQADRMQAVYGGQDSDEASTGQSTSTSQATTSNLELLAAAASGASSGAATASSGVASSVASASVAAASDPSSSLNAAAAAGALFQPDFRMPNRCSHPNCGAPLHMIPTPCSGNCLKHSHQICYLTSAHANGMEMSMTDNKCFDCLTEDLTGPFVGPCTYPNCAMPTAVTQQCSGCGARVHRPCVPTDRAEGMLVCPSCCPPIVSGASAPSSASSAAAAAPLPVAAPANPATVSTDDDTSSNDNASGSSSASPSDSDSPSSGEQSKATRNRGGRPKGTTDAAKRAQIQARKRAVDFVCIEYAESKSKAKEEANTAGKKRARVKDGERERLVKKAIEKYGIKGEFDVPMSTIDSRIAADNLEVAHTGDSSPVLCLEVLLKSVVLTAWGLNAPLSASSTIELANSLLEGSDLEKKLIKWKKDRNMYVPGAPLLSRKWFQGFKKRNPDLESKRGRKYPKNRNAHCNYSTFSKMNNQLENALVQSGNAVRLDNPVHKDKNGNIVEDEALAYGYPIAVDITRAENIFCLDETGDNTHGKDDGNKGGQKMIVPRGEVPREVVGTRASHFTVLPVTDFNGNLQMVTIIFAAKKVNPSWVVGVDVFVEWDGENYGNNFGPGRRHPGLSLFAPDGKEIPVLFAATEKASMDSSILMETFKQMNERGVTQRGRDADGNEYFPAVILDGHISRMGKNFLVYVNDEATKFMTVLGAPYGTDIWQVHDDERQNGTFKTELAAEKSKLFMKKRVHNLSPDLLPQEILIPVRGAIMKSYMRRELGVAALLNRGMNPLNRKTLDDPQILLTAPEEVQKERAAVLARRGIALNSAGHVPPTQQNLLETGSGQLAGGADAAQELVSIAQTLNYQGPTASNIMALMQNTANREAGGREHNAAAGNQLSHDELKKRYKDASRLTAGTVFGTGNGILGTAARDAVIERENAAEERVEAKARKKAAASRKFLAAVIAIAKEMKAKKSNFKWTNVKLNKVCTYLKEDGDAKMPTLHADLLARYKETKHRRKLPIRSDDESEEESDEESEEESDEEDEASGSELEAEELDSDDEDDEGEEGEEGNDEEDEDLIFGSDSEEEADDDDDDDDDDWDGRE